MPTFSCNSCNSEFEDETQQKLHYKSEWHRYNLKRKVAGVPGVTEALFTARESALAHEQNKSNQPQLLYSCEICGKAYRSLKAHAQHLNSRSHIMRTGQGADGPQTVGATVIKPYHNRVENKIEKAPLVVEGGESSEDEWVEVGSDEDLADEASDMVTNLQVDEDDSDDEMDVDLDPSCCFICDANHKTIEVCMVHMHKKHGFFIPDIEYLKDPKGLLTYLGLKVKRDFMCLYCNDRCQPFISLEAVRKHMEAKGHCKVRYGDGDEDNEEAELEEFYDYSSSYVDVDGKQLVGSDEANSVELGSGGAELVITRKEEDGTLVRTLGSREYLRYYRQKPRPSAVRDVALAAALSARYKTMGLTTVQSREQVVRLKVLREMNRSGVEAMRSKMGMKSNVLRNLPKNCTY